MSHFSPELHSTVIQKPPNNEANKSPCILLKSVLSSAVLDTWGLFVPGNFVQAELRNTHTFLGFWMSSSSFDQVVLCSGLLNVSSGYVKLIPTALAEPDKVFQEALELSSMWLTDNLRAQSESTVFTVDYTETWQFPHLSKTNSVVVRVGFMKDSLRINQSG